MSSLDFADFAYSSSFPLCLTAGLTKRPEKKLKAQNLGLTVPKRPKNPFFEILANFIIRPIIFWGEKIDETGFRSFWPKLGPFSAPFSPKNTFWTENGQKTILG